MLKVLHVISGLSVGGTELMLHRLLTRLESRFEASVVSLTDIGSVGVKIRERAVRVRALGMRRGVPSALALLRLIRWIREERPQVIQTWLYHADLAGGLAARLAGKVPVAWGLRQAHLHPRLAKKSTILVAKTCARLSGRLAARIVCCSEAVRQFHTELGYASDRMLVIPNGFDLDRYRPDPAARVAVREELRLPPQSALVGYVARFDPHKDHRTFFAAASRLRRRRDDVYFVLCGQGIDGSNRELTGQIEDPAVKDRCRLLGPRDDIPRITAALDVACSASLGEGFPNVVGEAMCCGVPAAVTDVGESASIVGATGRIVPSHDPEALAAAMCELLALDSEARRGLGERARARISERYSLDDVGRSYGALYQELADSVWRRRLS